MAGGTTITSLSEFRAYIKRRLGDPVVCVEIADEQLNELICDTIQTFQRYMYGEATYEDYLIMSLTSGTSAYTVTSAIDSVFDFRLSTGDNGINTLFSQTHQLLYNDWVVQGGYPGGPGGGPGYGSGLTLANYDTALMYLEEIRMKFGRYYRITHRSATNEIIVTPTPNEDVTGVMGVYRKEEAVNLYNHILVKKLAVALAKQQWGLHLKKYSLTLPGGGNLNGDSIYNDGLNEEEKVLEAIRLEGAPPDFYIA